VSLRFALLGSGSRGNSLLIETAHVRILLDCGFSAEETRSRLETLDVDPASLDSILVTHEHSDHMRGVGAIARRYQLSVWMTPGTSHASRCGVLPDWQPIDCHAGPWTIGDLRVTPYPVPHDAREPCQFIFHSAKQSLGVLTDLGHITPHILSMLQECDSLVLEFNHDLTMLRNGPYPKALKSRVGGRHGHLNNQQALALLAQLPTARFQYLVASHISEKNNSPQLVKTLIDRHLPNLKSRYSLAEQDTVTAWYEL
jgi:phosphoribosyl 1,2-cyclic phosphodiesterase